MRSPRGPFPSAFFVRSLPAIVALIMLLVAATIWSSATAQDTPVDPAAATEAAPPPPDPAGATGSGTPAGDAEFDFFSDEPVVAAEVVELPPEKPKWMTVGGPIALIGLFFFMLVTIWWLVPFDSHSIDLNLRQLPPAARRGIAMAVGMFGIAFCFGASEIWYQLRLHGSAEAYFAQMSLGKLIAFTHAHLFGFTTSFFIVGIPFSMQFNHLKSYQWVFPVGLAASLTDVASWWGIKYVGGSFEWVSMFCGVLFSVSYLWMLIGLLRTLLFPEVIWASDKDRVARLQARREREERTSP
ncbi:MAG TPA: hypothetical protein VJM11_01855 [Nevskiaceae bacterium]|nr:hypothetical protein [Nevskiaceae bacterium]